MIADALMQALTAEEQAQTAAESSSSTPQNNQQQPPSTQQQQPPQPAPDPAAAAAQRQQLELADKLQLQVQQTMQQAQTDLAKLATASTTDTAVLTQTRASVTTALNRVEDLRRLFFSVLEHLKETARRQAELGDETEAIAALADTGNTDENAAKTGPLAPRQQELATTAGAIDQALREQARSMTAAPPQPGQEDSVQQNTETAQRFEQAAEHVKTAQTQMNTAAEAMRQQPPPFGPMREQQNAALEQLMQAIALLQPPPQEQQQQQQQDQQPQQDQQQQQQQSQKEQQQQQQQPPADADLSQLMQGVRDREAERRRERNRNQRQGYEPVEKDW
jgi:hypothetical protein